MPRPGILWNGNAGPRLPNDGGKKRRLKPEIAPAGKSQNAQAGSGDQDETMIPCRCTACGRIARCLNGEWSLPEPRAHGY